MKDWKQEIINKVEKDWLGTWIHDNNWGDISDSIYEALNLAEKHFKNIEHKGD